MTEHILFYYPYASFTNAQLPLLKVAALWFDKLVILDPIAASWDTIGADHVARDTVRQLKDAGILEIVPPATVLAKYQAPIAEAIRRDLGDHEFLELCEAHSQSNGKKRWTLSLAKVPQDLKTDQAMRHLMGDFARGGEGFGAVPRAGRWEPERVLRVRRDRPGLPRIPRGLRRQRRVPLRRLPAGTGRGDNDEPRPVRWPAASGV